MHLRRNTSSPTASTSSKRRISASTWNDVEKASRTCIPEEYLAIGMSTKSSSSAKPITLGNRRRASAGRNPISVPATTTLSAAASWG